MPNFSPLLVAFWIAAASQALASGFFVTPNGAPSGNGSRENPWDLATALAQPTSVKPGDTIWLRGGTYVGHFTSVLSGSVNEPIVVRPYQGERVTIDGNYGGNEVTLYIKGSYTWYWGLEVTNSDLARSSQTTAAPPTRGEGVYLEGAGTRLINSIVHDTAQGILTTAPAPDAQIYGTLIYYNGFDGTDRGHGHGVYVQNETGTKRIVDSILFEQFGYGVHGYTESGRLDNIYLEGNTSFNNGGLSTVSGLTTALLVGASGSAASSPSDSAKVAKNTTIRSNFTYFSPSGGTAANLGYSKGIASPTIIDNYFVGDTALALINAFRPILMTGNTFYGATSGFEQSEFPDNIYSSARPAGVEVFVRPNQYERGRANITIYNWDKSPTVDVSLHGVMTPGARFELRNAQDFYGAPVLSGTYDGNPLHVPMNGLAPAAPVGRPAPPPTGPDFQVFVLLPITTPPGPRRPVIRPPDGTRRPTIRQRPVSPAASMGFCSHSAAGIEVCADGTPGIALSETQTSSPAVRPFLLFCRTSARELPPSKSTERSTRASVLAAESA